MNHRHAKAPALSTLNSQPSTHRGAALIVAVVCLVITMGIVGTMVRATMLKRQQLARYQENMQTARLVDAAVNTTERQLADQPDFTGGKWMVGYESSEDGSVSTLITTRVVPPDDPADSRVLEIDISPPASSSLHEPIRKNVTLLHESEHGAIAP
jgi:hypothetical protein